MSAVVYLKGKGMSIAFHDAPREASCDQHHQPNYELIVRHTFNQPISFDMEEGDLIIFDYNASIDGKPFKGGEGKNTQITLGKDLFLKGFDEQLVGVKKNDLKNLDDLTGEPLIQRDDDKEDTIKQRLEVYRNQTEPLVNFYQEKQKEGALSYRSVDGDKAYDNLSEEILIYLEKL